MCIDRGQGFVFHWRVFIITSRYREGDVSIERRCIKIAIIFNDRGICGVERSSEFSVSKSNIIVTLKEW